MSETIKKTYMFCTAHQPQEGEADLRIESTPKIPERVVVELARLEARKRELRNELQDIKAALANTDCYMKYLIEASLAYMTDNN
jgi:hypothetical protein